MTKEKVALNLRLRRLNLYFQEKHYIYLSSIYIEIIIWQFSYHTPYQPETPISARGPKVRGLIWVEGWYGVWYENCHIIIYLSYIFLSDKFTYFISYAESKARLPSVVIWVFCPGRKAVSPTWPSDMGLLPRQKSCITYVTHYHTFCASQE